ncbi:proteoglycan 4-like [Cydia amplana]|uniref:proteoglycan 4-like n=1 Tax=Cydia amplana TaxID=1869771 RepID=UPI002FE54217
MDINNPNLWYIIGGVGIIVLLIIMIGQTIALCYFRKKAQPQRRMDKMTPRSTFDRGDRARYSAPPCKKSKDPIPECDRDSHIYELVVVNGNYNKACELAAAVESEATIRSIRDRPPLPLPHGNNHREISTNRTTKKCKKQSRMASMATNLRLSITGSSNLRSKKKELPPPPVQNSKKAPARPPKQVDAESLPGSLKRPAKPASASAASSAPAFKPSTIPKNTATESPMSELKNIFKNRNIGKDTATSSPKATLETKNPPKLQTKPIQPTNSVQPKQPLIAAKPGVQPNQMKLILPKIETSLKTPKPIEPAISPTKPPLVKKPQPTVSNASQNSKWPHVLTETQQAPKLAPVKQKVQKSPIQNRALPKPGRPLPPDPVLEDDMPIYQMADGDTPDSEDDEEWTYEPLEQYNIYNN